MVNCTLCLDSISRNRPGIFCDGCKKEFHAICVAKGVDIANLLKTIPGLCWKCSDCNRDCILIDSAGIHELVENKLNDALSSLKEEVKSIKSCITKTSEPQLLAGHRTYAEAMKDKSKPVIVIHPKNNSQSATITKADILRNVDPSVEHVQLDKVRTVKDGGIMIGCKNIADNNKLMSIIQQKMSDTYDVKEVGAILPKFRLVGMSTNISPEDLRSHLLMGNRSVFADDSECKVLKVLPTKRDPDVYQAIVRVDKSVYDRAIIAGKLFVAYDSCTVYDAVDLYRCFKCNEFGHSSQKCNNSLSCPVCGENHEVSKCKSKTKKCTNCLKLNKNVPTDHAVWEREKCAAYIEKLNKLKPNAER